MSELHKKRLIEKLQTYALSFSEACVYRKQHKIKFTIATLNKKAVLQPSMLHTKTIKYRRGFEWKVQGVVLVVDDELSSLRMNKTLVLVPRPEDKKRRKKSWKKFHMKWLWGCLMYVMVSTRPDIAHALSILSRFISNPMINHWRALKWLLRYLSGTSDIGLTYKRIFEKITLKVYVNVDYESSKDTGRSTISYEFQTNGDCIRWKSYLQSIVALSTIEDEFMVNIEAFKEEIWLQEILKELKLLDGKVRPIFESFVQESSLSGEDKTH
uniref:Retrovirus-related Pol polyprotein from transposon TNT 1-94 n=1 Tax=Cannabis sativa TaxID=3483 RepID=A0A803NIM8_CANSA